MSVPLGQLFSGATCKAWVGAWERGWHACGPSIAEGPSGYAAIVTTRDGVLDAEGRYHHANETGVISTRNWFMELDSELRPFSRRLLAGYPGEVLYPLVRGIEDPRLYWAEDGWRYSGTIREHRPDGLHEVALLSVERGWLGLHPAGSSGPVKNLMPGSDDLFIDVMASDSKLHGGAVCAWRGGWLGVVHEVDAPGTFHRRYHHRFARFDHDGRLLGVTEPFWFVHDNIEFAAGIVLHKGDVVVTVGIQDTYAALARVPEDQVGEALCAA